jgi:glycine reductase complex component B subunit gamma
MIFSVAHGRWGFPGLPPRIFEGVILMTMSQSGKVRVVHYLNQFFSGLGGEEQAGYPIAVKPGAIGPGTALQNLLQDAEIVATIVCGDNWYHEHESEFEEALERILREWSPTVVVAGPAFNAGRYSLACGKACCVASNKLGIPAVAAMAVESPGADLYHSEVYIVPCAETAVGMRTVLPVLSRLAMKLGRGETLGPADEDRYLPRGVRYNVKTGRAMSARAVEMLLAKLKGLPFKTELVQESFEVIPPAQPLSDLRKSKIAIVTESGLVPSGNPDKLEQTRSTKWLRYKVAGLQELHQGAWESVHGGYDTAAVDSDPNRAVPLDALRQLESGNVISRLHDWFYVTTGSGGSVQVMQQLGREIAQELLDAKVDGVLLTAT